MLQVTQQYGGKDRDIGKNKIMIWIKKKLFVFEVQYRKEKHSPLLYFNIIDWFSWCSQVSYNRKRTYIVHPWQCLIMLFVMGLLTVKLIISETIRLKMHIRLWISFKIVYYAILTFASLITWVSKNAVLFINHEYQPFRLQLPREREREDTSQCEKY